MTEQTENETFKTTQEMTVLLNQIHDLQAQTADDARKAASRLGWILAIIAAPIVIGGAFWLFVFFLSAGARGW